MGYTFTNTAASTAAVTNRYVTVTAMTNAAYSLANTTPAWSGAGLVTVLHATVATTDTLGIVTVVGVDLAGQTRTEVITPSADTTVTGVIPFRTITSITSSGWTQGGATPDNITVGVAAGNIAMVGPGQLGGVLVNNTVAASVTISDGTTTIMTIPASQAAGTYYYLDAVDILKYVKVSTTNTNDITVFHTRSNPYAYQTS